MKGENAIIGLFGGLFGFISARYAIWEANQAIEVRPELAEVSYWTAMGTDHGADWLYYHYPTAMTIAMVLILGFIGFITAWSAQ